jgi:hypothetical protein
MLSASCLPSPILFRPRDEAFRLCSVEKSGATASALLNAANAANAGGRGSNPDGNAEDDAVSVCYASDSRLDGESGAVSLCDASDSGWFGESDVCGCDAS